MNRPILALSIIILVLFASSANLFGAAKDPDFIKSELIKNIGDNLDGEDEAISVIQGLKKESLGKGSPYYTYNGVKLEDMDVETLKKLNDRVGSEVARIRTDMINRQLETVRQAQRVTDAARQAARIPAAVTQPPQTPPRPPQMPPSVEQPPNAPQIPPKR